jgi:phosphatidylinositol glycan class O
MENGEIFTSLEDITAEAHAKAEKQRIEEAQLGPKPTAADVKNNKKLGEVHFKAAHGIIVAFFSFIL